MTDDAGGTELLPLGESALTIRLGETTSVELAEQAAALADLLRRAELDGVHDVVSAVASVSVYFDPLHRDAPLLREHVRAIAATAGAIARPEAAVGYHEIPTRYDGEDLDEVAQRTGLSREGVIRRHSERQYRVLAIGFLPGWGYLGPLDPTLSLPRRSTPRTRIPAGSVAIAGVQTGIYPRVSPGGWHLIGSTHVVLFEASRERPSLLRAGDIVRFVPVA